MNMPVELQKIIKEYSMPIYKRTLHFKALKDYKDNVYILKYGLESTPYTLLKQKLAKTYYLTDLFRGIGTCDGYHRPVFNVMYDISLTDVIVLS